MFRKKIAFCIWLKFWWLPSAKDNVYVCICKKQKKCETFLYAKSQTLCKNQDNFCYVFIYNKHDTLRYTIFLWNFWSWYLYTKSITLCVKWRFIYKNPDTLKKGRQFALRFYMQNMDTFRCATFHCIYEIGRGGKYFLYWKTMHFALHFYMRKIVYFALCFYIQKGSHFALHFFYPKNNALCITFI